MPLRVASSHTSLLIRKQAFERAGLTRAIVDQKLGLTDQEFRVEGELIVIGPVLDEVALDSLVAEFEELGLIHFDDFFDLSGNWPQWLSVFVSLDRASGA